jgi:DNA-binding transcriptional MerR regulator
MLKATDAARLAGLPYEQLVRWRRRYIVRPSRGGGGQRVWTPTDCVAAAVVRALRQRGIPLIKASEVGRAIQRGAAGGVFGRVRDRNWSGWVHFTDAIAAEQEGVTGAVDVAALAAEAAAQVQERLEEEKSLVPAAGASA